MCTNKNNSIRLIIFIYLFQGYYSTDSYSTLQSETKIRKYGKGFDSSVYIGIIFVYKFFCVTFNVFNYGTV